MIGRAGLSALTPDQRAAVIYGMAQTELSRQLWQAALGSTGEGESPGAAATGRGRDSGLPLESILDLLAAARDGPPAAPRPAMPSPPDHHSRNDQPMRDERAPATAMAGSGNARHAATLDSAAARTGIPVAALTAIVDAEAARTADGSWDTHSRNARSSAAGLGQFLSGTWEGMARMKGSWLHGVAQANGWLAEDGRVLPAARAALLASRYDPVAAINSIADYARSNLDGLRRAGIATGSDITSIARTAYIGHHLGLGDAIRFLRDGHLPAERARFVLRSQVGAAQSDSRIAQAGDAGTAHRIWLAGYMSRKFRPERFVSTSAKSGSFIG